MSVDRAERGGGARGEEVKCKCKWGGRVDASICGLDGGREKAGKLEWTYFATSQATSKLSRSSPGDSRSDSGTRRGRGEVRRASSDGRQGQRAALPSQSDYLPRAGQRAYSNCKQEPGQLEFPLVPLVAREVQRGGGDGSIRPRGRGRKRGTSRKRGRTWS